MVDVLRILHPIVQAMLVGTVRRLNQVNQVLNAFPAVCVVGGLVDKGFLGSHLPRSSLDSPGIVLLGIEYHPAGGHVIQQGLDLFTVPAFVDGVGNDVGWYRSEERRVGKECRL